LLHLEYTREDSADQDFCASDHSVCSAGYGGSFKQVTSKPIGWRMLGACRDDQKGLLSTSMEYTRRNSCDCASIHPWNEGVSSLGYTAAITAIEMASTRAVELTVQAMTIQLPLMALENPGRFALFAIRRWLGYAHSVTRYLDGMMGIVLITSRML